MKEEDQNQTQLEPAHTTHTPRQQHHHATPSVPSPPGANRNRKARISQHPSTLTRAQHDTGIIPGEHSSPKTALQDKPTLHLLHNLDKVLRRVLYSRRTEMDSKKKKKKKN